MMMLQENEGGNIMKHKTSEGAEIDIYQSKGQGTFSERYLARMKIDGTMKNFFLKKYVASAHSAGNDSRGILYNEIAVEEHLQQSGIPTLYRGVAVVDDVTCILYEPFFSSDLSQAGGIEGKSIADLIGEKFQTLSGSDPQTVEEAREYVRAGSYRTLSLEDSLDIASQLMEQITAIHEEKAGIIHFDICPANILLSKSPSGYIAQLIDFGISRRRGQNIFDLFNGFRSSSIGNTEEGTEGGEMGISTYVGKYIGGSMKPTQNQLYAPPDIDSMKTAEPSIDLYMLCNTLCLLLTGRLRQGWENKSLNQSPNLEEKLKQAILLKNKEQDKSTEAIGEKLASLLSKGTAPAAIDRYQDSTSLNKDILEARQMIPKKKNNGFVLSIPRVFREYSFSQPPLQQLSASLEEGSNLMLEQMAASTPTYLPDELFPGVEEKIKTLKSQESQRRRSWWKRWLLIGGLTIVSGGFLGGVSAEYGIFNSCSPPTDEWGRPISQ